MKVKLVVTQEHWDRALEATASMTNFKGMEAGKYCAKCVVAQAAREHFRTTELRVSHSAIILGFGATVYHMDKVGTGLVYQFDHGKDAGPPQFPIEIGLSSDA